MVTSWTVFAVNPEGAGEHAAGAGRLFEEPSGGVRYGSRRHRRRAAHRGRDAQAEERRQFRARAVSRRRAGRDRRDLRARSRWCRWGSPRRASPTSGKLHILAQTGPSRHPMLPDVPTTAEAGLPDVRMDTWFGLVGPPDMPKEIVARINRELAVIVKAAGVPGQAHQARPRGGLSSRTPSSSRSWRTTPRSGGS